MPILRTPTTINNDNIPKSKMGLKVPDRGDRVEIIAGEYKGMVAHFLGPAGLLGISGRVAIQDDSRRSRTLRLTSLVRVESSVPSPTKTHSNASPTVDGNQPDLQSVSRSLKNCLRHSN
jgi:hypothetical protein